MEVTPCVLKEIRMEVTPKRTMMNMLVFEVHDEYVGLSKFMICLLVPSFSTSTNSTFPRHVGFYEV